MGGGVGTLVSERMRTERGGIEKKDKDEDREEDDDDVEKRRISGISMRIKDEDKGLDIKMSKGVKGRGFTDRPTAAWPVILGRACW